MTEENIARRARARQAAKKLDTSKSDRELLKVSAVSPRVERAVDTRRVSVR